MAKKVAKKKAAKKSKVVKDDEIYVKTRKIFARVYGVSLRTVEKWETAGLPGKSSKGYPLKSSGDWRRQQNIRLGAEVPEKKSSDSTMPDDAWSERKEAADAQLAELKLDRERGLYCLRDDVERVVKEALRTLRLLLSALPVKAAMLCPVEYRPAIERDLADYVERALKTCRNSLGYASDPEKSIPVPDPFPEIDVKLNALPARVSMAVPQDQLDIRDAVEASIKRWLDDLRVSLSDLIDEGEGE